MVIAESKDLIIRQLELEDANAFWEEQGYSLRTNLNYRNKSLNEDIPTGE